QTAILAQLRGRCRDAIKLDERAIAIYEVVSKVNPDLAGPLVRLGQCQLGLGRPRDALAPLERAISIRRTKEGDPADAAEAAFALGQARFALDRRDAAVPALVLDARMTFAILGPVQRARAADVDGWLAAHADLAKPYRTGSARTR